MMTLKDLKILKSKIESPKNNQKDIDLEDIDSMESDQTDSEPKITDQTLRFRLRTNEITASFSIKLSLPDFSSVNVNIGGVFNVDEEEIGIENFCEAASQCMHEVKRAVVEEVKKLGLSKRVEAIFQKEYKKI